MRCTTCETGIVTSADEYMCDACHNAMIAEERNMSNGSTICQPGKRLFARFKGPSTEQNTRSIELHIEER